MSAEGVDQRFAEYARTRDERLRDDLVGDSAPLARHLARRFSHRGEPPEELEQVAMVGLFKAVERFEPDRGGQFSTFAVPTILGELKRHFRDRGWAVRIPRRLQELHLELNRLVADLTQELGRSPTPQELARSANVDEEDVLEAMEAGSLYNLASLDAPTGLDAPPPEPPAPVDEYRGVDEQLVVEELLSTLPERERVIVELRFFAGLTQSEIASRVGISQMHVSRLLTQSLSALRETASAQPS
jgi:RNA polymerase sigma-B factor